jgi:hypothetical protein
MPDKFLPFSPISEGPIDAQSDIADHGYRTTCPPMVILEGVIVYYHTCFLEWDKSTSRKTASHVHIISEAGILVDLGHPQSRS